MTDRDILVEVNGTFERWFGHKNHRVLQHRRCKAKGQFIAFWLALSAGLYAEMNYDFDGFESEPRRIYPDEIMEKPYAKLRGTNG
jgi:hypothetical protein